MKVLLFLVLFPAMASIATTHFGVSITDNTADYWIINGPICLACSSIYWGLK